MWHRVNAPTGAVFTTVLRDGVGFLAVAANYTITSEATDYAPTFWRSTDGLSWHQIHLASLAPFVADRPARYSYVVTSVVRVGSTLVAVGERLLFDASTGDAAMWYSPDDGTTWHRTASGATFPDASVFSVAHGSTGYVAVGSDGYPGASTQNTGSRGAAVWTSPDGRHWVRVGAQAAFGGAFMTRVTPAGRGYIATGTIHTDAGVRPPAPPIWTSDDGRTWHRTRRSASLDGADEMRVNAVAGGYVATGTLFKAGTGTWDQAAWWSRTGTSWSRATTGPAGYIARMASVGGRLVGIGSSASSSASSSTYDIGVWTSIDGRSWQAIPLIESFRGGSVLDAAGNGDRLVVVGENADPNLLAPAGFVWVAVRT